MSDFARNGKFELLEISRNGEFDSAGYLQQSAAVCSSPVRETCTINAQRSTDVHVQRSAGVLPHRDRVLIRRKAVQYGTIRKEIL